MRLSIAAQLWSPLRQPVCSIASLVLSSKKSIPRRAKSSISVASSIALEPKKSTVFEGSKAPTLVPRAAPAYDATMSAFSDKLLDIVKGVYDATDPAKSAMLLRKLVQSKLLLYTDMKDNPEKFFLAHRLLSTIGLGGFGIRFTVQFNLFAGSIVGLGGPQQLADLDEMQTQGKLGCFLLTGMQALCCRGSSLLNRQPGPSIQKPETLKRKQRSKLAYCQGSSLKPPPTTMPQPRSLS